jgi:hypothetical protein
VSSDIGNVVGSRLLVPIPPLESIEARLPVLAAFSNLERENTQTRLLDALSHEQGFRLDLFVKDVPKAATIFQSAARSAGLSLALDSTAQDRLRKKLPTALVVYTEALSPEDIVKFLVTLSKRDQTGTTFATLHLVPTQTSEQRDLRDLLGIELGQAKRKPTLTKSTSNGTGGEARVTRPAIMLTYLPAASRVSPASSKEIRAFLDQRTERKPSTVALVIVIRPSL